MFQPLLGTSLLRWYELLLHSWNSVTLSGDCTLMRILWIKLTLLLLTSIVNARSLRKRVYERTLHCHAHFISHYRYLIQQFGAPNGLCLSITECKHIKAVKEPWRRSSHNEPLGQMLLTNQRLDKLAAARVDFNARGMLKGPLLTSGLPVEPPPGVPPGSDGNIGVVLEPTVGRTTLGDV